MAKKLIKMESYTTICWYEAEITDEQAELFKNDQDKFYELHYDDIDGVMELRRDKIVNEETEFSVEG